jgi:hypothetical protein
LSTIKLSFFPRPQWQNPPSPCAMSGKIRLGIARGGTADLLKRRSWNLKGRGQSSPSPPWTAVKMHGCSSLHALLSRLLYGVSGNITLYKKAISHDDALKGFPFAFGVFQDYYSNHEPFAGSSSIAVIGTCAMVSHDHPAGDIVQRGS